MIGVLNTSCKWEKALERNRYNELLCGWLYVTKKDNILYKIGVINDVKNVHLQIKESIEK